MKNARLRSGGKFEKQAKFYMSVQRGLLFTKFEKLVKNPCVSLAVFKRIAA